MDVSDTAAQAAKTPGLPFGFLRWAFGVALSVAVLVVLSSFQGNEVKDYLRERGLQVASVEVSGPLIRVDMGTSGGEQAARACEALRGTFADGDGRELVPRVTYDGGSYSGTSRQPCRRSNY